MAGPVPVHPEAVAGHAQRLRWVVPAGTLDVIGPVSAPPAGLADLVADGTVVSVTAAPNAVVVELGAGRSWRTEGARVRTALQDALAHPADWRGEVEHSRDEILRVAADEVVAGEVGDYIRSHGGLVAVLGVQDGVVQLSMSGACSHCPASDLTLTGRIETAVRARCPWLRGVRAENTGGAGLRRLLPLSSAR